MSIDKNVDVLNKNLVKCGLSGREVELENVLGKGRNLTYFKVDKTYVATIEYLSGNFYLVDTSGVRMGNEVLRYIGDFLISLSLLKKNIGNVVLRVGCLNG